MADSIIKISNLSKLYHIGETDVRALNEINLEIFTDQITLIVGPSGSGKTTLLNMIGGIDSPTSGSIEVLGEGIHEFNRSQLNQYRKEKVGFIFQFFNLIPNLSAKENIEFIFDYVMKKAPDNRHQRSQELLELIGLDKRSDHLPFQLSGGEQQRVAIARAFAKDPAILLADEPTGELDHKTGHKVLKALIDLRSNNRAIVIVTHDRELEKFSNRIIRMIDGQIESIEENPNPISIDQIV